MRIRLLLSCLFMVCVLQAQLVYHDASAFPLLGKATQHTASRYERLPDSLRHSLRQALWQLGENSAGLAVRFRTNSATVAAAWEVRNDFSMNHMTPTGIKGLDLYVLHQGQWRFAGSGRPQGKASKAVMVQHMQPQMREYLLYLPLYDGLQKLEIGIDSAAQIACPAVQQPVRRHPVVFYGTSILQGGCASRPGMAHTNILERWLNRECINLGFSGNALLDLEIAHVAAKVDAGLFVLDFAPNATVDQMKQRAEKFYGIIRAAHQQTPILFVEDPHFTHAYLDREMAAEIESKNQTLRQIVKTLQQRGDKHCHLLTSIDLIGADGEATVDGIHFTDLGFMRYAKVLYPLCARLLQ